MNKRFLMILAMVLWCNVGVAMTETEYKKYQKEWEMSGGADGDPNQNIILESTKDYIVIRNLSVKAKIYHKGLERYIAPNVFSQEAINHCNKNDYYKDHTDKVKDSEDIILDDHTVYYYCTAGVYVEYPGAKEVSIAFLQICFQTFEWEENYKLLKCKKIIKEGLKKWPNVKQVHEKIMARKKKFTDPNFIFELKKRVFEDKKKIEMTSMIDDAKSACKDIGHEEGTDRFEDCSLDLYKQSVALAAKNDQQIVIQSQGSTSSSGSNVMTIYDPVRDSNALFKRGQGLINGTCTLGDLSTC
jgi:hypothetical protein